MSKLIRVQSAHVIKRSEILNQQLLDEANRLLDNLEVVPSLTKFKEYIERMKVKCGDQFPQLQLIIEQLCSFAIRLQKNSGKSDLPILIAQWVQDIARGTPYDKIIQQTQAILYRYAAQNMMQVTEKTPRRIVGFTSPKTLTSSQSEVKIKTFYYQNGLKNLSDKIEQVQLEKPKQKNKQFVIKKDKLITDNKKPIQQEVVQSAVQEQQIEKEENKFDWSSSEDEKDKPMPLNEVAILEEKRQKEARIKFLIAELNLKFEARVIEIKKSKDEIIYPIQAIIRLQAHQRRKIAQRRKKALEAAKKREELQKRYEELIRKIQSWFRALRIRRKFRDLAYKLLDIKKRTINPRQQYFSAIVIQRCIRKCVTMKRFNKRTKVDDNRIRQKVITFNIKEVSDKIQNKLFFFIMKWEDEKITVKLSVYAKKKCDRLLIKPFELIFSEKKFWYIYSRLIEYIEQLKAEIEPNQNYLKILQNCWKIGQNIVKSQGDSYKLLKKKQHILKQLGQIEFEELLYMDGNMKLELAGFTDFQYSDCYQQAEETHRNIINNIKQLKESEKLIILVQTIFKQRKAINIMRSKINRKRNVKAQFGLSFKGGYAQIFINTKDELFARVIYQRKWQITNKLKISQMITKQLGYPSRENFFDIYQFQENTITYTEEGIYWINKEEEQKHKKKVFSFSQIEGCIRIIQNCARKHLTLKQVMLRQKLQQQAKENTTRTLVKKVVLSGQDPIRAFFMSFGVEINETQEATSITIDVRSIEHNYQNEYIHPYRQPLYDKISIDELVTIGQKMIQIGEVKQVKGQIRFHVRNLMEVQGLLLNDQDMESKKSKEERDDTLQARKLWSQHMRKPWIRALETDLSISSSEGCAFKKVGKKKFNAFLCIQSHQSVWKMKHFESLRNSINVICYDQESISDYVRQFEYVSEYGYGEDQEEGKYNIEFLEIRKKEKDEYEERVKREQEEQAERDRIQKEEEERQKKLLRDSLFLLYQEYNVISQQRIYIRIIYNKLSDILEVKGKTEGNIDLVCNINLIDVLSIQVELEYLKETLKRSVVKQLYLEGGKLLFDCDPKIQEILLTEYLTWQRLQNRQPKLANVEGSIYNLRDLFINLKVELSMYDNLCENGYQVFKIRSKQFQDRRHEYLFNLSCQQLVYTIYFDDQPEKFKTHIMPAEVFECRHLMDVIKNDPPESITKLLYPTMNYLDEQITINHDYTTNFTVIQPYLSRIFKEQMVIRLQRRYKIRNQYHYYLQYRKRNTQSIFLAHRYVVIENRYIKVIFFLCQYIIKMVFQQLNSIDPASQQNFQNIKKVYYINLLEQNLEHFDETKEKWIENQGVKMPRYYQQTYKPFIEYVLTRIRVEQPFEIVFGNEFKITKPPKSADRSKTDTMFYNMIDAVIKLQVHYKTFKQREVYNLQVSKTDKSLMRQIGKLFSRSIKVIQDQQYLVNMYRIVQGVETQITVDLINFFNRKQKYRGIYILDSTEMVNIGQLKISEYILNMTEIKDELLQFQSAKFQNLEDYSTSDTIDNSKSPGLKLETRNVENTLIINHYEQPLTENNPNTVYNVTYTGSAKQKCINQPNSVQIAVDLSNFKKLYPCLHQNDQIAMKTISDSIIEAVQVDKQGQVQVNIARINPSLIQIENNQIQVQEFQQPKVKPESQIVLAKKITYFTKRKFLLKISILERKVTKIQEDAPDSVEQHYESLYQVVAMSLEKQNKEDSYIEWELSSEDAQQLTHQKQQKKIALELSKRTLIVQGKFIFLAIDKVDIQRHHYPNCILFLEKGIKPIQRQFRNRKRLLNFREYKQTVKQWKDSNGHLPQFSSLYLESLGSDQQFIVLSGEDKSKRIMLICWNLDTFDKFIIEIPKQQYQKLLMKNKGLAIKLLTSYVEYKDFELYFRPPQMSVIQAKIDNSTQQLNE